MSVSKPMADVVAAAMGAATALSTNLLRPLPVVNCSASSSIATRSSSNLVVWRNSFLMSSGSVLNTPTSRKNRFPGHERIPKSFGSFLISTNAAGGDYVTAEVSLEGLFLSSDEAVDRDDEEIGTDIKSSEEGQKIVYLNPWQMKKMIAASNLGTHCVNVEVLAADVGLDSSDVVAWLENAPSKTILLTTSEGSYMEDVHIVEEAEKPAVYVPPPPIPLRDVNMRNKVEDFMYSLKDIMAGHLTDIVADEKKCETMVKLFCETVEIQNPLFCFRGRDVLVEWVELLGRLGVVIKLHDIYYENIVNTPYNRWVYATWTATLTNDLLKSIVQLGLTEWWARCHDPQLGKSSVHDKQHAEENQTMNKRILQLSGEWRFEMDESGEVTNVRDRWYKLVEQEGGEDFIDAKLWLSGILRRGFC